MNGLKGSSVLINANLQPRCRSQSGGGLAKLQQEYLNCCKMNLLDSCHAIKRRSTHRAKEVVFLSSPWGLEAGWCHTAVLEATTGHQLRVNARVCHQATEHKCHRQHNSDSVITPKSPPGEGRAEITRARHYCANGQPSQQCHAGYKGRDP